jgi:hypothetical protein
MANRLCQFSTLPSIILNSEGAIIEHNRAFAEYWKIDPSRLHGPNGYTIFNDPFFRRKDRQAALQKAFHGAPVKFDASGYQFPAGNCRGDSEAFERQLAAIYTVPCPSGMCDASVTVYYQTEASLLLSGNADSPCEKIATLTLVLNDLKHEISNPLLLIIGHAQLLLAKSDRLPAEAVKKLEKILNNAEKIRCLLQERQEMADLLQVSDEYNVIEQS